MTACWTVNWSVTPESQGWGPTNTTMQATMIATVSTGKRRVGMLSFSGSTGAGCHTQVGGGPPHPHQGPVSRYGRNRLARPAHEPGRHRRPVAAGLRPGPEVARGAAGPA